MPVFCRFRDITTYWSKICFFRRFYPLQSRLKVRYGIVVFNVPLDTLGPYRSFRRRSLVWSPHEGVPLEHGYEVGIKNYSPCAIRCWKPRGCTVIIFESTPACDERTDRHSDRHAAYNHVALSATEMNHWATISQTFWIRKIHNSTNLKLVFRNSRNLRCSICATDYAGSTDGKVIELLSSCGSQSHHACVPLLLLLLLLRSGRHLHDWAYRDTVYSAVRRPWVCRVDRYIILVVDFADKRTFLTSKVFVWSQFQVSNVTIYDYTGDETDKWL